MFRNLIHRLYWNSSVSLSEFEDYKEEVLDLLEKMEKATRALTISSMEHRKFKDAQCTLNKIIIENTGIKKLPSDANYFDVGTQ
jgi:hypothetical protein